MAEYAGFQDREGTDFAGSINDLATKVSGLETKVKEVRASDKKLLADNDALLSAHKPFNFTGAKDFAAKTAVTLRQHMYELNRKLNNREISPSDYRTQMQNISTDHGSFMDLLKTADDRTLEEKKRLEPGPNGEKPIAAGDETLLYAEMQKFWTELPNKQMFVGPNGKLATAQTDADGKIVEGTIFDLAAQMNVSNIASNRLDLSANVKLDVARLGGFSQFTINADGSTKDISAIELDPKFNDYATQIIGRYINNNNPKTIGGILVDNSNLGYAYYTNEENKKNQIEDRLDILRRGATEKNPFDEAKSRKEIESKMIQLKQLDNGVWSPVLSEELKKDAYNIVYTEILSQLGYDEKGTGVKVKSGGGGGLTEKQQADKENQENYTYDVYVGAANGFKNGNFSAYNTDLYYFDKKIDAAGKPYMNIYSRKNVKNIETKVEQGTVKPLAKNIYNPEQVTLYLRNDTGATPPTPNDYRIGKEIYKNRNGSYFFDYKETYEKPASAKKEVAVKKSKPVVNKNSKGVGAKW